MSSEADRHPDILTTKELSLRLGLSQKTIRRMAAAGQLPALRTGKDLRYSWQAVLDTLRRAQDPHTPAAASARAAGGNALAVARDSAYAATDSWSRLRAVLQLLVETSENLDLTSEQRAELADGLAAASVAIRESGRRSTQPQVTISQHGGHRDSPSGEDPVHAAAVTLNDLMRAVARVQDDQEVRRAFAHGDVGQALRELSDDASAENAPPNQ
ncbi:DNA binding domain-containing protein, excisionase family [Thermomonospora echinospora]|uniref:DNA binding domain-containing protein, excisionase family n=1 Tax=Thermomonospora echinospora TaxID=1992 RepID=A0A1H6E690_9ACTN|nr:helix-turn-helix domain-containing protein [Thermomonospora echinospora]SEG92474.1 DNA binding domain-containing protein, excisionase family [Thermomonospora echinospora]